jgi:hypothetical protein
LPTKNKMWDFFSYLHESIKAKINLLGFNNSHNSPIFALLFKMDVFRK